MSEIILEQALYRRIENDKPQLLARSAGFQEDWLGEAEEIILGFGDRPPGMKCPWAVFALPFASDRVVVVQVADRELAGAEQKVLGFHLLVMGRRDYEKYLGDPFVLAQKIPAPWEERSPLPSPTLPAEPLPPRTIQDVQRILQRVKASALAEDEDPNAPTFVRTPENSESPALLGGIQVLVDGGKLVFERSAPDLELMPGLWMLLPTSTRCRLWPASFAFCNSLGFDALVAPRALGPDYEGYTSEEQATIYPQGKYELNLQIAVESGDQRQLDILLSRRSWDETWRLGIILLILIALLALVSRL